MPLIIMLIDKCYFSGEYISLLSKHKQYINSKHKNKKLDKCMLNNMVDKCTSSEKYN